MSGWLARCRLRLLADERGMVTAEAALVLPVLVLVSIAGVAAVQVSQAQLRCADAAREAGRAVARGEPGAAARLAQLAAGRPVAVQTGSDGPDTVVTVRLIVRPLRWIAPLTIAETAVVATEPTQPAEGSVEQPAGPA